MSVVVRADDLTLGYRDGQVAAQGVTFELREGEILGIVGEAGSGKTTLARAVAVQSLPGEREAPRIVGGDLSVLGSSVRRMGLWRARRLIPRIGYLPQDGAGSLEPRLTTVENISAPLLARDRRITVPELNLRVAELLDAVRLPLGTMERFPHELSRGQRQRVALARALVLEPELLVLDDPTMGVDLLVRGRILAAIAELQQRRPFSAIVIGGDLRELRPIIDRVAVMHAGLFVGYGPVDDVLARPLHPYVARLAELNA